MATATEVVMPRLSDSMESGVVAAWLVAEGEAVAPGRPLAEIDTDKATVVVEAEAEGRIRLLTAAGADVPVGAAMAEIVNADEYVPAPAVPPPFVAAAALAATSVDRGDAGTSSTPSPAARLRASPVARRLAAELGIDLATVTGSGPEHRVLKTDILRLSATDSAGTAGAVRPLTRMQETIARRMTTAKQTIPHFYLATDVDVTDAEALRRGLRATRVSLTDLVVRAVAIALARMPEVNAAWSVDGLIVNDSVNIGLAVALDDGGLVVPVLHDADRLSLPALARRAREAVQRARAGTATARDLAGATFTVSNLGMFGIREFHAIVNPPESGILAVGAAVKTPVVREDAVVVRALMALSLSADHRVYSGATGARFLDTVRQLLETPLELVLTGEDDDR